ncbi:MAG TPA: RtcB family protein [Caldisericia bacterium]|nr:RtcB family protein [Caldisericia bacterium]
MKVFSTHKFPVKSWCPDVEDGALAQAENLANLPFLFKHVALMPDCHQGYGMPIGGVIATKGVVIPNAVGVDIGCGMSAVRTSVRVEDFDEVALKKIMGEIRKEIPVGFNHRKENCDEGELPNLVDVAEKIPMVEPEDLFIWNEKSSARKQLGTLGGGNHFIEIQKGSDGFVWVMIHSGSRNLGKKVADHYNKIAVDLNEKYHSSVPKEHQLAFLPLNTQEARNYLAEMNYCVEFAKANRKKMMSDIERIFRDNGIRFMQTSYRFDIAHNYARMENHFGENVMIHRKGATSAKEFEFGIIPGSMGSSSYIVRGLGNPESFCSCSHGAGRKMGRNEAQKKLILEDEIKRLDEQGIIHGVRNVSDLDEATGAYKDINEVMNNQKDLVEIVVELKPLGVIKG